MKRELGRATRRHLSIIALFCLLFLRVEAQYIPCEDLHPVISSSACGPLCAGSSVVLDAGPGYASYRWSNGSTTQRIVLNSVEANGAYRCEVQTVDGCVAKTAELNVKIYDAPAQPYIVQKDTVLLATPAAHISWLRNKQLMNYDNQQSIVIHDSAEYQIIVSDEHGCSARSETVQAKAITVSGSTRGPDARLKIYPNPTRGLISVQLVSDYEGDISFSVVDIGGRERRAGTWTAPKALDVYQLDLSDLPDGSYILHARDGVDVVSATIILQH